MAGGSKPGERRGGRQKGVPNKATAEIKALAQEHGPDAIATLVTIMKAPKQPPAARVAAAKELLDRAYGKAAQAVIVNGDEEGGPIQFSVIKRMIVDPK